jgi:hypothetical protein
MPRRARSASARTKKRREHVGFGPLDFVSVGLAAATGRIDMGTWFAYLHAYGGKAVRKKRKTRVSTDTRKDEARRLAGAVNARMTTPGGSKSPKLVPPRRRKVDN